MLAPGAGRVIAGGGLHATLKVPGGSPAVASKFEVVVPPGFDVGAHVHRAGQELCCVLGGELALLAGGPQASREGARGEGGGGSREVAVVWWGGAVTSV